ncbi:MAG: AMP-binding protein [Eubacteriales bacterium]|nr:AMP-binding protein [Eubacteriales bacterium]
MKDQNSILDALEKTGLRHKDKIAVKDPEAGYTWSELIVRSKRAGKCIAAAANGRIRFPAAILADKSADLLSAMTGVIYAGGFYAVINPEQPAKRIEKILETLSPEVMIAESKYQEKLLEAGYSGRIYDLELLFSEDKEDSDASSPEAQEETKSCPDAPGEAKAYPRASEKVMAGIRENLSRESPLYGIFTSGSTGNPKCVLVSHGAVIDFIGHFAELFDFRSDDVIASQAPFDFDVSIKDIFTAFFTGASLLLIPREYFSTAKTLMDYLCDNHATSLTWAVSALCIISGLHCFSYRVPDRLRRVMFSGEVMPVKQLNIWMDHVKNARFVNLYGPSEITCNCMYYEVKRSFATDGKLPLGKEFPGRTVLLLDEGGNVIHEKNQPGEICVMGESLALGYYGNPEETARHFVRFGPEGQRMYRTGDLAYYGDDGEMYFAGRKDFQIKHMGHRIELEEIERSIDSAEGVERCLSTFDQKKNRIYLYYKGEIDKKTLHRKAKELLPLYMVPNKFIHVKDFLLNKNGKTDRKALPTLEEVDESIRFKEQEMIK